jgi:predicted acetyltransferase
MQPGAAVHHLTEEISMRSLLNEDEAAALAAHEVMQREGFPFLLGYDTFESWSDYVHKLEERSRGLSLAPGWVPATFLVAIAGEDIVGRASIRHRLNDYLASAGGHVGYCVLPEFRGRGYATEILRQSVNIARSKGIHRVLVTCDVNNVTSARAIEKCSGRFESVVEDPKEGVQKRRYWIG